MLWCEGDARKQFNKHCVCSNTLAETDDLHAEEKKWRIGKDGQAYLLIVIPKVVVLMERQRAKDRKYPARRCFVELQNLPDGADIHYYPQLNVTSQNNSQVQNLATSGSTYHVSEIKQAENAGRELQLNVSYPCYLLL